MITFFDLFAPPFLIAAVIITLIGVIAWVLDMRDPNE